MNKLTYKIKFQMLIVFGFIFLFLIFNFGVRKTIEQYKEYNALKSKKDQASLLPERLAAIRSELEELDKVTNGYDNSNNIAQPGLLEIITGFGKEHDLVIRDFPQTVEKNIEGYTIEQNKVVMAGSFFNALELVFLLEQKNKMGQVVSLQCRMSVDKPSKKKFLETTFFIQKIRSYESN